VARRYRRRKAPIEDIFDILSFSGNGLSELIKIFPPVGVAVTILFLCIGFYIFDQSVMYYNNPQSYNKIITLLQIQDTISLICFFLSAVMFLIAFDFAVKTWQAFSNQNYR
jgi:hypothetical protein